MRWRILRRGQTSGSAAIPRIRITARTSNDRSFAPMNRMPIPARADEESNLAVFRSLSGDLAARDAQDLMAYPFFSLAKSKRTVPIDFRTRDIFVRVEGTHEHGIATIWDADVLIWAASQIVEARDQGSAQLWKCVPTIDCGLPIKTSRSSRSM